MFFPRSLLKVSGVGFGNVSGSWFSLDDLIDSACTSGWRAMEQASTRGLYVSGVNETLGNYAIPMRISNRMPLAQVPLCAKSPINSVTIISALKILMFENMIEKY